MLRMMIRLILPLPSKDCGDANSENSKPVLGEIPKDSKDPTEETCAFTFIYALTSLSLHFRSCFSCNVPSCLLVQDE